MLDYLICLFIYSCASVIYHLDMPEGNLRSRSCVFPGNNIAMITTYQPNPFRTPMLSSGRSIASLSSSHLNLLSLDTLPLDKQSWDDGDGRCSDRNVVAVDQCGVVGHLHCW